MLNFNGSGGAYFLIAIIVIGWILGIILPPVSAWNRAKYIGQWAGSNTGRYFWKGFWWGYNKKTRSAFIIYNGPRLNFQVQTWRPRFAVWGIFKKRRAHIGLIQWVARNYCLEAGRNTWYSSDISHPYNINVYLESNISVAIGAMRLSHLIQALRYARPVNVVRNKTTKTKVFETMEVFCECMSFDCTQHLTVRLSDMEAIRRKNGHIIVNGCKTGPSKNDKIIESNKGYVVIIEPEQAN